MKKDAKVTPWEVSGKVDYNKVIKEFGVSSIDEKSIKRIENIAGESHFMLRRGIFFAHRDLKWILDEYEKGNKFFLYTGRAPSGKIHLGHLLPWIFTKWLQDKFDVELWFQFPDEEKFLFKDNLTLDDTYHYFKENAYDVIYKEAIKVAKKITFSTTKAAFGFTNDMNIGAIFYTSMQTVPAFLPSVLAKKNIPCLIPMGFDQDPHFRISRDVITKLGFYKPAALHCRFLPALSGPSKMSASEESNAVYTIDSPDIVENKIKKYAFSGGQPTIKEHREKGGNPEIDISYQWLTFLEEDDKKLQNIYHDYKSGALLTSELKQILINKINGFLKEHQKKREKAKKQLDKYMFKNR